ncbi:MAG: SUMF1/EgtB/PvdO family nonheme iron enzyme [Saprospiraceae bacterium]|nr:SUMF1/EgtB/PvdO family nonheme iron enzyme [Saprospiraceae bacterium]
MSTKKASVQIFIAYSQKDRVFLDALRSHATPLLRKGNVTVWFDGEILPSEQWNDVIKKNLHAADIILMLLSANALASDYFYEQEVKDAVDRHRAGTARVVPVVLSPCQWKKTPLAEIQGLPRGMKPIISYGNMDEAWNEVVEGLWEMVEEIEQGPAEKPDAKAPEPPKPVQSSTKTATAAEEHAWEFTTDTNTRAAYQKYLDRFPQGFYSDKARDFLEYFDADDTAWEFANDAGTDQAIQKYIKKYPKGLHTEAARKRIDPFYESMVPIKGGTFEMGDLFEEGEAREKPVHKVTLYDFMMCKYPVTQGLWKAVMGADNNPSHFKGDDMLPVENVSWDIAQEFIEVLNKKSGASYRLPTEAEWEYAAREGGKKVRFGNGKDVADPADMNFDASEKDKQPHSVAGTYRGKTSRVDLFKPNALGLYDMSGNVWEWCADFYAVDYYQQCQQQGTVRNPQGPETGALRVFRGGSWANNARYCRVAYRSNGTPGRRGNYLGFRLVLAPQSVGRPDPAFL